MSKGWRDLILRAVAFIAKHSSNARAKILGPTSVSSLKSVLDSSRHFDIIKASYEKLDGCIHSKEGWCGALTDFVASQLRRRSLQQALFDVQKKRDDVNKQLDVVSRADDSFLSLITKEHELAREEAQLASQYHDSDLVERAAYEKFTSLLRYLHVEERNYDMRMRQWALVGSIIVGFCSAFVTWLRFRTSRINDLRDSVEKVGEVYTSQMEIASKLNSLCATLQKHVDFRESIEKIQEVHFSQMRIASQLNTIFAALKKQVVESPSPTEILIANTENRSLATKFLCVASTCALNPLLLMK
ncbi:Mitochondrial potassium channel [Taenia crassiceps]|uniref:Mitochondrial potassium channel n=1 Tax=Taenia crassiceps TaxID=6207 RepID=A0ABR4PZL9_9CEST